MTPSIPQQLHDEEALLQRQVGQRLRAARLARGVTQEALAAVLGVERVTVSRYETGQRSIPLRTLIVMAQQLETSLDVVVGHVAAHSGARAITEDAVSMATHGTGLDTDLAQIVATLQAHPELIPTVQDLLQAMLESPSDEQLLE